MPTQPSDDQIRERAYQIWQEAGCPDGREHEFWHKACEQLGAHRIEDAPHENLDIDKASEESFPASDPVNHM